MNFLIHAAVFPSAPQCAMSQDTFVAACASGDLAWAKTELAKPGVRVDGEHSAWGNTALGVACVHGHLHAVQWLVEDASAGTDVINRYGYTPLHLACSCKHLDVMKRLTRYGVDPRMANRHGETPFWTACVSGYLDIVRWLAMVVGVGSDISRVSTGGYNKGFTPLAISREHYKSAVVSWLTPFLQRRVLIAYWSTGRDRWRANMSGLGCTLEATAWHRLPREAMGHVLLLLGPR